MTYDEARPLIQSGDLLAWGGKGFLSWLVRVMTGSSWSHVGIVWKHQLKGKDRLFVLEASFLYGVRMKALSDRLPFDWITTEANWTDDAELFAFLELGKPYSVVDAIRAGFKQKLKSKGWICSEYARSILERAECVEPEFNPSATPEDLIQKFLDQGSTLTRITG